MSLHQYIILKKANDEYEKILSKEGFSSRAENLLYTIVDYCMEHNISSEEFNFYF